MDSPLSFSLNLVLGPILLGTALGWGLFGILCVQTYLYYRWYPKDDLYLKCLVGGLFALELAESAISTHAAWYFLVSGWGDPVAALGSPWSICTTIILTGIIALVAQLFFAARLWRLSRSALIVGLIFLVALAQCACAIVGAFQIMFVKVANSTKISVFESLSAWLGLSAGCDILIALGMVFFLLRNRSDAGIKATEYLITRLINFAIRTGVFTAACAMITLIFFLTLKTTDMHDLPFLMLAKLYSNAVLANLNARASLLQDVVHSSENTVDVDFAKNPLRTDAHGGTTQGMTQLSVETGVQLEKNQHTTDVSAAQIVTNSTESRNDK